MLLFFRNRSIAIVIAGRLKMIELPAGGACMRKERSNRLETDCTEAETAPDFFYFFPS